MKLESESKESQPHGLRAIKTEPASPSKRIPETENASASDAEYTNEEYRPSPPRVPEKPGHLQRKDKSHRQTPSKATTSTSVLTGENATRFRVPPRENTGNTASIDIKSQLENLYSTKINKPPIRRSNPSVSLRARAEALLDRTSDRLSKALGDLETSIPEAFDWTFSAIGTVFQVLQWTLAILWKVLRILQWPIALGIAFLILYAMVIASVRFVCKHPPASYFDVCKFPISPPVKPNAKTEQFIKMGLDYTSQLEDMQHIAAESITLPYHLSIGEGDVRGMIIQLSANDLPTKERLLPILQDSRDLVERTIDGLQDWLTRIDQVVDHTIQINEWAELELQRIEDNDASLMKSIYKAARAIPFTGKSNILTTEGEVRQAFFGLTEQVNVQVTKAIAEAQRQRGNLAELKTLLETIALIALQDKGQLEKDKLNESSYWQFIFKTHRHKMAQFDQKMEMCARFSNLTDQAMAVTAKTMFKLQQMRQQLKVFRDGLADNTLVLDNGKSISLRLYINKLKTGVKSLEATREATRSLKSRKMLELEQALRDR